MCAVELAGSVTDPEEVGGGCVVAFLRGESVMRGGEGVFGEAGEALFVFEEEALVAGVDIDCFDAAVGVDAHCVHEAERILNSAYNAFVLLFDSWGDYVPEIPV